MDSRRNARSAALLLAVSVGASSLLAGCAAVTAVPLQPDGISAVPNAQTGFRYFLPRPYLLVARAPASASALFNEALTADRAGGGSTTTKPDGGSKGADGGGGSSPASDTSFQAGDGKTYIAKLVYLPDYSRPMSVELSTGLVGISKVDMTLQDGWMLTNVSANADNSKMADVLIAAVQALSTGATGGATAATSKARSFVAAQDGLVLRPGLYAFEYDYGMSRVSGICAVAFFGSDGSTKPPVGKGGCGPEHSRIIAPALSATY